MAKPSIVIVPGAFGRAEFYQEVVDAVAAKGYDIRAVDLPTVVGQPAAGEPLPTMYDDAAVVAAEVTKLADQNKDIILLPHSYGGVPATQSTKGLTKAERRQQGKSGGVVRLAYMTSLIPPVGVPAGGMMGSMPEENKLEFKIDEQGWMHHTDVARAAAVCFTDLPAEQGQAWIKKFDRHSSASFASPLTHAGYKDVPVSYLVCENDLCIPVQIQKDEIAMIEKETGGTVDVTSIQADHIPPAGKPQSVVDWILDVAGKVENQ